MKSFAVIAAVILSTVMGLSAQDITNQGVSIGRRVGEGLVVSKRQTDLDALKTLTVERARKTTDVNAGDAKALATGFARELEGVGAYGSLAQLLDRNMPELARQGYVGIRWMFDAVNPDRVHVTCVGPTRISAAPVSRRCLQSGRDVA
jgi:hypothetical protein